VERQTAVQIADVWYDLAEGQEELRKHHHVLSDALQATLPEVTDTTDAAAAALIDDAPGVVAIVGDGLFLVTLEMHGDDPPQPVTRRLPLVPQAPELRIRDCWREAAPATHRAGRQILEWTLVWPHGEVVVFESRRRRRGGLGPGPDPADRVGRALAARLGWNLPD
jgi:hypothetical protein